MKILLVQHTRLKNMLFPLGLGYVAAVLLKENHIVDFIDLAFEQNHLSALKIKIENFKPEVIGVTLITTGYSEFVSIFKQIKQESNIPIVAGGVHASIETENVLNKGIVDIVVNSEGEIVAPELFRALEKDLDLSLINGISYIDEHGKIVKTPLPDRFVNLDLVPSPPYGLFHINKYTKQLHGIPATIIITSRGCPYNCTFCYRGPASEKKVRYMSLDRVMSEISDLYYNYGIKAFFFWDEVFTLNRNRIMELCKRIKQNGLKIFWVCQTRVDLVDYELLRVMKNAGCINIQFGVESGHPHILKKFNKGISTEQIKKAFKICQKLWLPTSAFFILGTPWDTRENINTTIQFAKRLKSTNTDFFAAIPYPGTLLKTIFERKKMPIPENTADYWYYLNDTKKKNEKTGAFQKHIEEVREICNDANKAVTKSMLISIKNYPRLLTELTVLYGLSGCIKKLLKGISDLLTK